MISIIFSFKTKPGMNLEFLQTIGSIIVDLRHVEGCENIDFQQDHTDKEQFTFRMDWVSSQQIKTLITSKEYDVFEGAMKVLCHAPTVEINAAEQRKVQIQKSEQKEFNVFERIRSELLHN